MIAIGKQNYRHAALVIAAILAAILMQGGCVAAPDMQNAVTIETGEGPRVFHIDIADDEEEQKIGLMNRESLPQDAGMLFIFPEVDQRTFWMKDTLIALDLLFIAEDGEIHHIHHMARPLDHAHLTSKQPVKAVLEINGGLADTLGIKVGDKVIHPIFRNQLDE